MQIFSGTSGYAFKEWRGCFYPEDLADDEMLAFYAGRLNAVEINNSFYRVPKREVVASWGTQVPDGFSFSLKASRRISHNKRLKDCEETVGFVHRSSVELGAKLGCNLVQLPPNFKKDAPRLAAFLDLLPEDWPTAIEFRHPSWRDEEIDELLRTHSVARCESDALGLDVDFLASASYGYLRLREEDYSDAALKDWGSKLKEQPWERAFVFFKHEKRGPEFAARFVELAN